MWWKKAILLKQVGQRYIRNCDIVAQCKDTSGLKKRNCTTFGAVVTSGDPVFGRNTWLSKASWYRSRLSGAYRNLKCKENWKQREILPTVQPHSSCFLMVCYNGILLYCTVVSWGYITTGYYKLRHSIFRLNRLLAEVGWFSSPRLSPEQLFHNR